MIPVYPQSVISSFGFMYVQLQWSAKQSFYRQSV